jgi:hypothetical protein
VSAAGRWLTTNTEPMISSNLKLLVIKMISTKAKMLRTVLTFAGRKGKYTLTVDGLVSMLLSDRLFLKKVDYNLMFLFLYLPSVWFFCFVGNHRKIIIRLVWTSIPMGRKWEEQQLSFDETFRRPNNIAFDGFIFRRILYL